jgi:antirestriction protein ArdC
LQRRYIPLLAYPRKTRFIYAGDTLPPQTAFQSPEEYYCTAFHELSHSTMHEDRLNRKVTSQVHQFGDEAYSKEELVAECESAFLSGHAGIENTAIENSASYIHGWLKALKNDRTLLIHAAAQAQKTRDYILKRNGGEEEADALV